MNEQLKARLGEYLLSEGIQFDEITHDPVLEYNGCGQDPTIDLSFRVTHTSYSGVSRPVNSYHEIGPESMPHFLEFLVTGGE